MGNLREWVKRVILVDRDLCSDWEKNREFSRCYIQHPQGLDYVKANFRSDLIEQGTKRGFLDVGLIQEKTIVLIWRQLVDEELEKLKHQIEGV